MAVGIKVLVSDGIIEAMGVDGAGVMVNDGLGLIATISVGIWVNVGGMGVGSGAFRVNEQANREISNKSVGNMY